MSNEASKRVLRADRSLAHVREASCLAHVVPGVSLRIPLANDDHLLVSSVCLGADLDPCQLRAALIVDRHHGLRLLSDTIIGAEIASGLLDLGGGLYQRTAAGAAGERWFTSTLGPQLLADTLQRCEAHDDVEIVITPDSGLGVSAVCMRTVDDVSSQCLDESAMCALGTCLVAELMATLDSGGP